MSFLLKSCLSLSFLLDIVSNKKLNSQALIKFLSKQYSNVYALKDFDISFSTSGLSKCVVA